MHYYWCSCYVGCWGSWMWGGAVIAQNHADTDLNVGYDADDLFLS